MRTVRPGDCAFNRITIQKPVATEAIDSFGQPNVSGVWTTLGTYWANIEPLRGIELMAARQIKAQATIKITMRWQGDSLVIDPTCRGVLDSTRILSFFSVMNVAELNYSYVIMAYEIQAGGLV